MGTLSSKEVRRISFDNTFAINPAIVQKSIEDDNTSFGSLAEEIMSANTMEKNKYSDTDEISETNYWPQRVEKLKKEHQIINKIIETEYENTIENHNKLYKTSKLNVEKVQRIKPCFDWRSKILQCYEDNPHQPLVCSSLVQGFSKCVESCRMDEIE